MHSPRPPHWPKSMLSDSHTTPVPFMAVGGGLVRCQLRRSAMQRGAASPAPLRCHFEWAVRTATQPQGELRCGGWPPLRVGTSLRAGFQGRLSGALAQRAQQRTLSLEMASTRPVPARCFGTAAPCSHTLPRSAALPGCPPRPYAACLSGYCGLLGDRGAGVRVPEICAHGRPHNCVHCN